ncbi:NAD(+) diphosphatase [Gilvimarinus algae]|uniref:NAD(+) diphosphatase n=1 Tax=Gilvimarinus algae TaxID=3058037 RepID=A0ABT8TGT4_9GAMM|nr:NAD(+) diphosphatase [Gilvimarinus sp. SDUM040014]MDO3382333.1 NAD(+) diphosphatase [Gilvimarinus sp. SDUM040014]
MSDSTALAWLVSGDRLAVDKHGAPLRVDPAVLSRSQLDALMVINPAHGQLALVSEKALPEVGQWLGLRECLGHFSEAEFAEAGRALQLSHWWYSHQFCSRCGGNLTGPEPQQLARQEFVRRCNHCSMSFYPRLSPCVIVLVTRGEYCLLAHHARARRPVFTTLAGFVEAGERIEQTVHREVAEEVGIEVRQLRYVESQSWPFPGQLMLGFYAEYAGGELKLQEDEIVDAGWYRYDALPHVPPAGTIARRLIDGFVEACENAKAR